MNIAVQDDETQGSSVGEAQMLNAAQLIEANEPLTPMKFHHCTKDNSKFVPGRRGFFQYCDTGVTSASNGRVRAQITTSSAVSDRATGWHYHLCETQVVYFISGWTDVEFEDGTCTRVVAGDVLYIPGGVRHNELGTSEDFAAFEVSLPADMGTVACDAPDGWKPVAANA